MNILVIDPIGGISGDMLLGSLIHLGCPVEYLQSICDGLCIGDVSIQAPMKKINGITGTDLIFDIPHTDKPRSYADITALIKASDTPEAIKFTSIKIFDALAKAESQVHEVPIDRVHFHEVGAIDSILDIVCIAAALDMLCIETIYTRTVPVGIGTTKSMHGTIPVPAPATVELLKDMDTRFTHIQTELTTPTGAAVLSALCSSGPIPNELSIKNIGYGCGKKDIPSWFNMCRSILCETRKDVGETDCYMIEADIDDMDPQQWETATRMITEAGALDTSLTHRIMKKSRPGVGLKVICGPGCLYDILNAVFTHTSTIGVRYYPVQRQTLSRKTYSVQTRFGPVAIKEVTLPSGKKRHKAEYRDMNRIALDQGITVYDIAREVDRAMSKIQLQENT